MILAGTHRRTTWLAFPPRRKAIARLRTPYVQIYEIRSRRPPFFARGIAPAGHWAQTNPAGLPLPLRQASDWSRAWRGGSTRPRKCPGPPRPAPGQRLAQRRSHAQISDFGVWAKRLLWARGQPTPALSWAPPVHGPEHGSGPEQAGLPGRGMSTPGAISLHPADGPARRSYAANAVDTILQVIARRSSAAARLPPRVRHLETLPQLSSEGAAVLYRKRSTGRRPGAVFWPATLSVPPGRRRCAVGAVARFALAADARWRRGWRRSCSWWRFPGLGVAWRQSTLQLRMRPSATARDAVQERFETGELDPWRRTRRPARRPYDYLRRARICSRVPPNNPGDAESPRTGGHLPAGSAGRGCPWR